MALFDVSRLRYRLVFGFAFCSGPIRRTEGNEDCDQHTEEDQHSYNEDNHNEYAFDVKYLVGHFEILMVLK